jgi:hypothetical protein
MADDDTAAALPPSGAAKSSGPTLTMSRVLNLVLLVGLIATVGLPALWEAQPHLHPSALFCRSSCTASPLALLAPDKECGSIALTLLKKREVGSTDLSVNFVRRPPTMVQARALARCSGPWSRAAPQDNICYMVMTSSKTKERTTMVQNTWATLVQTLWMISDEADGFLGTITFPELEGKGTYEDAQHRHLVGLQRIANSSEASHCQWFWVGDDDSYVNPMEVAALTEGFSHSWPIMLAFLWFDQGFTDKVVIPSGGGGMLYSRAGALAVAEALYSPKCPFNKANDVTLGACNAAVGVLSVHTQAFDPLADHAPGKVWYLMQEPHQSQWASIHHISPEQMSALHNVVTRQYGEDSDGDGVGDVLLPPFS